MSEHRFEVFLNPDDTQAWDVWGELRSTVPTEGATLLILVSGITFDHRYWDFSGGPSFVEAALREGSNGATISIAEAARYGDVSAVVLTGNTHQAGSGAARFLDAVIDVADDPMLLEQGFPADYQTLRAGAIGDLFFHPQTSSAPVVALNEAIKGTFTRQQNLSLPLLMDAQLGEETIEVPVLTVFGDKDVLFGDNGTEARLEAEPKLFPRARRSTAAVVPRTGHSLALATTADLTNDIIFRWLREL